MDDLIRSAYETVRLFKQIGKATIAKILRISEDLIVRIESWAYCIFVHRRDRGGQFVSYRKLRLWLIIILARIKHCPTWQQLWQWWLELEEDFKDFDKQYEKDFLDRILDEGWMQRWVFLVKDHPIMSTVIDF